MKRTLSLLLATALVVAAPAAEPDALFGEIGRILADLEKITGLKAREKIRYDRIGRAEVQQFLRERVKEALKPEEIRTEETVLKKFGFVPQDFNLEKTTIELLSEQAAAFYDYRKKKLFVIDGGGDLVQHSALVHELAHALADQHFGLEKFIKRASKSDDGSLARLAVMEGQATWLMSEYLTRQTGQSLKDSPLLLRLMARASEVSAGQFPVYDKAPLYLRETLLFPYTQGMLFQHALVEKLDKAGFSEVFRRPPATTQQILHPEKYFAGVAAVKPPLPELEHRRQYRQYTDGEVGELDHVILLKQYAEKDAGELASEWRGGYYRLMEHKKDKRLVLLYASEWSSPEAARRFFELYPKVLAGKWKKYEVLSRSEQVLAGQGDEGPFRVTIEGARVTSAEGAPVR